MGILGKGVYLYLGRKLASPEGYIGCPSVDFSRISHGNASVGEASQIEECTHTAVGCRQRSGKLALSMPLKIISEGDCQLSWPLGGLLRSCTRHQAGPLVMFSMSLLVTHICGGCWVQVPHFELHIHDLMSLFPQPCEGRTATFHFMAERWRLREVMNSAQDCLVKGVVLELGPGSAGF